MKSKKIGKIRLNLWKGKLEMINQPHWLELTVISLVEKALHGWCGISFLLCSGPYFWLILSAMAFPSFHHKGRGYRH